MAESAIREVRLPDDGAMLLRLIESHARYERGRADPDGLLERLARLVEERRLLVWVATLGDAAVGYASATVDVSTWNGRPFMYLDCLFVSEEHRGGGLGAELLRAVIARGQDLNVDNLQWQTPIWNTDAVRFYDRFGPARQEKMRYSLALRREAAPAVDMV